MVVRNQKFTAFIDEFTSSTYIMVIVSDPDIEQEAIALNIKATKDYFESIVQSSVWVLYMLRVYRVNHNISYLS